MPRRHGRRSVDTPAMSLYLAHFFFWANFLSNSWSLSAENRAQKIISGPDTWGLLASATGMISNVNMLIVIRFMLGVVESAVMPSMLILLSRWFTKKERSRANTFLILGNPATILWMSILSGYLIDAVGWRNMFIIEGLPAVVWAFFWWFLINDKPQERLLPKRKGCTRSQIN